MSRTGRRLLITGASGFLGAHLAAAARAGGAFDTVIGTGRRAVCTADLDGYLAADLLDPLAAERLVRRADATDVAQLAAEIGPDPAVETKIVRTYDHLAAALRRRSERTGRPVRLLTVGSAAELGPAGVKTLPATEEAECEPVSPYGRGKLAVTRRALAEPGDSGVRCVVGRVFNLCGPGLPEGLALGRFAAAVAAAGRGELDVIRCGPLDARRDYLDARDAAGALLRLLDAAPAGSLFNVCRGESHRIGDLLQRLIELGGVPVRVEAGPRRAGDLADVVGDSAKLRALTGWRPRIELAESLRGTLEAARREPDAPARFSTADRESNVEIPRWRVGLTEMNGTAVVPTERRAA